MPPSGTRIRRLRARLPRQETLNTRRTLERLLITCDPSENLLPSGALLCIRQMRDPLPGALTLTPQSLQPPRRWRDALDTRWQEFLAHASRPFHDPSAAAAPAVLFADESELLACLARSAVDGRLRTEWWWTSLLQPDELPDWLRRWQRRPQILPTALQRLAEGGTLSRVLRSIPEDRAGLLLQALRRSHGLVHLPGDAQNTVPTRDSADPTSTAPHPPTPTDPSTPHRPAPSSAAGARAPTWARLLPELADPSIPRSCRAYAAVGLLLIREPRTPRQPDFIEALLHWLDAGAIAFDPPPAERRHPDVNPVQQPAPDSSRSPLDDRTIGTSPPRPGETASSTSGLRGEWKPSVPEDPSLPTNVSAVDPGPPPTPVHRAGSPSVPELFRPTDPPRDPRLAQFSAAPAAPESTSFSTEFGGVFFLLNVALSLRLYADFTEPLTPGLDLSPWDLLDLLAVRSAGTRYLEDPLRLHLAAWAGRSPDALPGAHFQPQVPSPTDPGLRILGNTTLEPPHLSRWLDRLVESIELRLHRALPSWETGPRLPRLVRQGARVESFDTTLQIRFGLESHPIAIRLAGLDRDPGWIPAAGRTVLFVFEAGSTAATVRRP